MAKAKAKTKTKDPEDTTEKKKKYAINYYPLMAALDAKNRKFFDTWDTETVNKFNPFMPQRWMTNLMFNTDVLSEYLIRSAAEQSNLYLGRLGKEHKKLQYLLLTTITPYPLAGLKHESIKPVPKTKGHEKKINALGEIYPTAKISDLEVSLSLMTDKEFAQLLDDFHVKIKDD